MVNCSKQVCKSMSKTTRVQRIAETAKRKYTVACNAFSKCTLRVRLPISSPIHHILCTIAMHIKHMEAYRMHPVHMESNRFSKRTHSVGLSQAHTHRPVVAACRLAFSPFPMVPFVLKFVVQTAEGPYRAAYTRKFSFEKHTQPHSRKHTSLATRHRHSMYGKTVCSGMECARATIK